MKKLLLLLSLSLALATSSAHAAPQQKASSQEKGAKVHWLSSLPRALAEAKRTGKPIFLDFYTTWCSPCAYLENVTGKDPRMIAESKKWVMVKIDAEKGNANVDLAEKYKAVTFPTLIFLNSHGREYDRVRSNTPATVVPAKYIVPIMQKAYKKARHRQ